MTPTINQRKYIRNQQRVMYELYWYIENIICLLFDYKTNFGVKILLKNLFMILIHYH